MGYFDNHPFFQTPGKKIFPVVHVEDDDQALHNTELAFECGADGIFLIHHHAHHNVLSATYEMVREAFPDQFIGINFLDLNATDAYLTAKNLTSVSAVWTDDSGIYDDGCSEEARNLADMMKQNKWPGLYFAGVAHKGSSGASSNPEKAASAARKFCHVITTSGSGTGTPAHAGKLALMRQGAAGRPLVTASGVTQKNAQYQLPHIDGFLVASSVAPDFYNFDKQKLLELTKFTHQFDG